MNTRRWHVPWTHLFASVVILVGVSLFLYPHVASWFSLLEQSRVTSLALKTLEHPSTDEQRSRAHEMDRAHAYNDALASGALLDAGSTIPQGAGLTATGTAFDYRSLLRVDGTEVMGRLRYESLDIDLPIFHGTAAEAIEHGVGHLEGTSLPVGGIGTRAVLTSHRGLPAATLFTNLDRAAEGDTFTVSVLDEVLTYRVVDIQVIEPADTRTLWADPGRDLVTLITCTPLGVNTHRIVVTGVRVVPTPERDITEARRQPDGPGFPWWAPTLAVVVVGLGVFVGRSGRTR
ncbi:class C sortase [Microbacterium sp.]|uniref:class C sortase n=1 Tax=Microbacterium sp. TaxID=51671 RepID=UPI003A8545EB